MFKRLSTIIPALFISILAFGPLCAAEPAAKSKPNILFILIDTLRADHLGYMGYERPTSPNIDELAKKSVRFKAAYGASSWTAPCVASIFTGLAPSVHGMMPPNSRTKAAGKFSFRISPEIQTIAEALKGGGYKTAGISANEWISDRFGYTQGFDYFFTKSRMTGDKVNEKAMRVLDKFYDPAEPMLLYLHYMDPHDPYSAPEPFSNFFKTPLKDPKYSPDVLEILRKYDNEIRFADDQIGKFLEYAKKSGFLDNAYVILTADHGEQFRERGNIGHGYTLFNEEIHVPLLVFNPKNPEGKDVDGPVSHLDIFPTILNIAALDGQKSLPGIDLLGADLASRRIAITSEVSRKFNLKAAIDSSRHKIIGEYPVTDGLYAPLESLSGLKTYDLANDPDEKKPEDIFKKPELLNYKLYFDTFKALNREFKRYKVDTMEMSDETFKELKSLGYF